MTKIRVPKNLLTGGLLLIYLVWAAAFIYQSSFVAVDGKRYFSLFDDGMISMRYAWNFSHGQGLVWNPGERVEGYSNLFMVLVMSLATLVFSKVGAVLAMQILGIAVMLGIAFLTRAVAVQLAVGSPYRSFIGTLSMFCVLFYFPLNYWSLMGMETAVLALFLLGSLLFCLKWQDTGKSSYLIGMSILGGLAFLTRNDSIILVGLIFVYQVVFALGKPNRKAALFILLIPAAVIFSFIVIQTLFRLYYYGEWLPNTYFLKLGKFPLRIRLIGGSLYMLPFVIQSFLPILMAALGLFFERKKDKLLLFSFLVFAIAYEIWVGGDPWDYWRIVSPAMPMLFILAVWSAPEFVLVLRRFLKSEKIAVSAGSIALVLLSLIAVDFPFRSDMGVLTTSYTAKLNKHNMDIAVAINDLTSNDATIGVVWAGLIPYYADRYAIDFLGKSDKYIASLPPDISGDISWSGMISVPGHNKYDLNYSIKKLQPTYIQAAYWGRQNLLGWVQLHYVRVQYRGVNGIITLRLLKDSPYVLWNRGTIVSRPDR